MHRLAILHISDLHMTAAEDWRRRCVIGDPWARNLDALLRDGPLGLICFTGDLVQAGKPHQYAALTGFVDALLDRTDVPRERLFVVPGNHDVDRSISKAAWKKLRAMGAEDGPMLARWMAGGKAPPRASSSWPGHVMLRQQAYQAWVRDALGRPELLGGALHPRLGYRVEVPGFPFPLHVVGLDSAWLAGDDSDAGNLHLTDEQVGRLCDGLTGLRIALIHHPLSDLADGVRCRRLLADRVDLLLRGHLHETDIALWKDPDRELRELAAGCLYQHDTYANACQRIDVTVDDRGKVHRLDVRFRAWSQHGYWFDDGGAYETAPSGRWSWRAPDEIEPERHRGVEMVFVGRDAELAEMRAALLQPGGPIAICALQGMAGVGKSYLADRFAYEHRAAFPGGYVKLALPPGTTPSLAELWEHLARKLDCPREQARARMMDRRVLLHIENTDDKDKATVVAELATHIEGCAIIVSGRSRHIGSAPGWKRIDVHELGEALSLQLLEAEVGPASCLIDEASRTHLAVQLGHLPLALHLAAGYLCNSGSVSGFLAELKAKGLAIEPVDTADPLLLRERSKAILSSTFGLSLQTLKRVVGKDCASAFAAMGHAPPSGVGRSLGAAIVGLEEHAFERLMVAAVQLSMAEVANAGWRIHPLLAEFLRTKNPTGWLRRMTAWFVDRLQASDTDQTRRWAEVQAEGEALIAWLANVPIEEAHRIVVAGKDCAIHTGPFPVWMRFCERLLLQTADPNVQSDALWILCWVAQRAGNLARAERAAKDKARKDLARGDVREAARAAGALVDILTTRGELDEALRIAREEVLPVLDRINDERERAVTLGKIAEILTVRGEYDEVLRICSEEMLPVFDRVNDARFRAVTRRKIADVLEIRGEYDEALRILKEEVRPVVAQLGDARELAKTMGQISDILERRGERDEALRIRQEQLLPVHERIGDLREWAMTKGRIADILEHQGDFDTALRIRREQELPAYERLGDVRERALAMGRIADILEDRDELDGALRIRQEQQIPVYERLGATRELLITRTNIAQILIRRAHPEDRAEAAALLRQALAAAEAMRIPEVDLIRSILRKRGLG